MDKGEERVGLLCSAGGVLVGRKFALLLFALSPSLAALSRPPSPSFVFSSEPVLGAFHLWFRFPSFSSWAVCSHQAGLDESERVAAGLHAPRKTHTFSPKRDHLLLQRDACVERRRKKTGPDEKKSERDVVSFKIAVTEVVKTSSIWAPLA